ncbi:glycosyltransferase [Alphaproteobacteria bacterium]|nr:glycosyltransferase [Alphaproteobacteria bacterium]
MHNFLIIPAFKPNKRLISLIKLLNKIGNLKILVVNNGNDIKYNSFFEDLSQYKNTETTLVRNNLGKGYGIKMGLQFIKNKDGNINACIFADADGQHTFDDIVKILDYCNNNDITKKIIIGARQHNIYSPILNRVGNYFYNFFFNSKYQSRVNDCLSGLRAVSFRDIELLINIKENDFRFEVSTLKEYIKKKYNIIEIKVSSTYFKDKKSHFLKFKDSIKLLKYIFSK